MLLITGFLLVRVQSEVTLEQTLLRAVPSQSSEPTPSWSPVNQELPEDADTLPK